MHNSRQDPMAGTLSIILVAAIFTACAWLLI